MEFTGERFTPDCVREIWYEHWHRYVFARQFVSGREVLDLACGEGYGSRLLAGRAGHVVGIDRDAEAVAHARSRYPADNLEFRQGSAAAIPLEDDSVDVVVSFETVEHLHEQAEMIAEFRRVLRPDGVLVISTPDREEYAARGGEPNPFHVRELDRSEFDALLASRFPARRWLGQRLLFQSAIWPLERHPEGLRWEATREGEVLEGPVPYAPLYLVALCAERVDTLPDPGELSLFGDAEESVYRHYYHEIRKNMQAGELLAERDREIERLRSETTRGSWLDRLTRGLKGRPDDE